MSESIEKRRRRGVVAVCGRNDHFLVIRRSATVAAPRKYCFPGGEIEEGESESDAIRREMQEELNVEIKPDRLLWNSVTPWQVELSWWKVELADDQIIEPNPDEVESFHWWNQSQMRGAPDLLESNVQFLDALERGEFFLNGIND